MGERHSPLKYPGGKGAMAPKLEPFLPVVVEHYIEPFCGGAAHAFIMAERFPNASIKITDIYKPVVEFFQCLQSPDETAAMTDLLLKWHATSQTEVKTSKLFAAAKTAMRDGPDRPTRAAGFWCDNRLAFSGISGSDKVSHLNFVRWRNRGEEFILDLANWTPKMKGWTIALEDYAASLTTRHPPGTFIFCDPPYAIRRKTLYGHRGSTHKGFDDERFQAIAEECDADMMVTYNGELHGRFRYWPVRKRLEHGHSVQSNAKYRKEQAKRLELVLLNYTPKLRQVAQTASCRAPEAGRSPNDLRALLKELGLTQREAADHLGKSTRAMTAWLSGDRTIPLATFLALEALRPKAKRTSRAT